MSLVDVCKIHGALVGLCCTTLTCLSLSATSLPQGIIGGQDNNGSAPPMAGLINSSGQVINLNVSSLVSNGVISSVALNAFGTGLIGGKDLTGPNPFAALVSPSGQLTNLNVASLAPSGLINGVAINNSGMGLIGGLGGISPPLAALVTPSGQLVELNTSSIASIGIINSVALNNSGIGLFGGENFGTVPPGLLAAFVTPSGQVMGLDLSSVATRGSIVSVALNASGVGIVGGEDFTGSLPPIAAFVTSSGQVTKLNVSSLTPTGEIFSVAINNSGMGLVGGQNILGSNPPLAALISPSGSVIGLDLSSLTNFGVIKSVAINDSGTGLIGGEDDNGSGPPLAAFIAPSGTVTKIDLSSLTNSGIINSVAISSSGAGLIGGEDFNGSTPPLAALITPSGQVVGLDLSSLTNNGVINSVALLPLITSIPTLGLTGNNRILANYINTNASDVAFYFLPSILDGTLAQALESVAPTRNAFAIISADNNFFFLENGYTQHIMDLRHFRHAEVASGQLLADARDAPLQATERRPNQLWGTLIGAVAKQKAQHQTPTFQPWTGGAILGYDSRVTKRSTYGLGAAYAHTYLHEKEGAGHSRINQEYLFTYGVWEGEHIYGDAAIWGGLFQINNVRNIEMTGFAFKSTSHPKGWQVAPHAEIGYCRDVGKTTFEPFAMVDWIANWQKRYKEKGSGPFNFSQRHHYSSFLRSELGLRLYETCTFSSWRLVFEEKGSYVNKKPFHVGKTTAALVGAPGAFTVETFTTTQNLGVVGAEMLFEPFDPRYPYGSIAYQGEFGSKYQSHQLSMNLSWYF